MTPFDQSLGDPRGTSQGAGTGRAVIYQDRFDPAQGFMDYALIVAERRAKKQQEALARQKEINEKFATLDYEVAAEIDNEELALMRDNFMTGLVEMAKGGQYGDVLNPGSKAGQALFKAQKELDAASTSSAANAELLKAQQKAFSQDPAMFDADEYEKRLNYYQGLKTIRERNDFLSGKIGMPSDSEGAGVGLLVENVDFLTPIEDMTAAEFETITKGSDGLEKRYSGADVEATRDLVIRKLASGPHYERQVNRWLIKPVAGYDPTLEGYTDYLTDQLVDQTKKLSSKKQDQVDGWTFGNGFVETGDYRLTFGTQDSKYTTYGGQKAQEVVTPFDFERLGIGANDPIGISAIATKNGKAAPAFIYSYSDDKGVTQSLPIIASKIIKVGDRYYLQGQAQKDAARAGSGNIDRQIEGIGGLLAAGDLAVVPLDVAGNDVNFEAQIGVPLEFVGKQIDEALASEKQRRSNQPGLSEKKAAASGQQTTPTPKSTEQVISEEVDAQVEAAFSDPLNPKNQEVIENRLRSMGKGVKFGDKKVTVGAEVYDLTDPQQAAVFKLLYGTESSEPK